MVEITVRFNNTSTSLALVLGGVVLGAGAFGLYQNSSVRKSKTEAVSIHKETEQCISKNYNDEKLIEKYTVPDIPDFVSPLENNKINTSVEEMEEIINDFRKKYKSWREGKACGVSPKQERMLVNDLREVNRNRTQSAISAPNFGNEESQPPSNAIIHLWHRLNRGPEVKKSDSGLKVTIIGGGAFGTSMGFVAANNNHKVIIYVRNEMQAKHINELHENKSYLPGQKLPHNLHATTKLEEALENTNLIIHALPAQHTPHWIKKHRRLIASDVIFCSTAKGLYLEKKCLLSAAILRAFNRQQPLAFLSGPSFALEIVKEDPTAVVVASHQLADAVYIQRMLSSLTFRVYASQDVIGTELAGALKNPLAVGAGIIQGLGFGVNTMSAYISRSIAELTELCVAMGGNPKTIAGLAGVGDLMLTAFGELSRNRKCGIRLVQGETLSSILQTTTVEGVPTASVATLFADKCNLNLPIFRAVAAVINDRLKPENFILTALMDQPLQKE